MIVSDKRTRGWLFVDSPAPTLLYTLLYLAIVWVGPRVMKNRKPFKLTVVLIPYNLAMAFLNAYIAVQVNIIITVLDSKICVYNRSMQSY